MNRFLHTGFFIIKIIALCHKLNTNRVYSHYISE